jgi:hypothetical protein
MMGMMYYGWAIGVAIIILAVSLRTAPPRLIYALADRISHRGLPESDEQLYREDLQRFPENGWALFGLLAALRAERRTVHSDAVRTRFRTAWATADVTLTASRF